ncbi:MAG: two-component system response regulator CreB [Verrucomicrobiales bacterium]|nr:two-component system response regulator CreB [Verrucomicrobiales bacterium]
MSGLILIVDDEPAIADTVEYALKDEGFDVILAETGRDGLDCFEARKPDLIVLDVGLPDILGFDVCREIRKTSNVPVLFLTARESEIDRVVGLEIGADDYVIKPFSPRELAARVKAILRRFEAGRNHSANDPGGASSGDCIAFGRMGVDLLRMKASLDGIDLGLSRYELGLLNVFVNQPGRVFNRDQLMEAVWDEPEAALDRTVDAHIKTLRSKFRQIDPQFDPIVTHRAVGYSLMEDC